MRHMFITDAELEAMAIDQRNEALAELTADFERLAPMQDDYELDRAEDAYLTQFGWTRKDNA